MNKFPKYDFDTIFCLTFPRFKFWSKNEPDNYDRDDSQDGEDCTRMGEKSNVVILTNWFDKACNSNHKSICEKSAVRGHPLCV